ncbi:MAG: tetratricopeptide repeat protein [Bacteroidia bacterium]
MGFYSIKDSLVQHFLNGVKKIHISALLLLFFSNIEAQDTLNSLIAEQRSYQLYQDKNWKELAKFGKKALKEDLGYFYLEMRTGIAYYEQKNYMLAAPHFKKAIDYNRYDDLAKEYLYYCYVFTGRNEEARKVSRSFSNNLSRKTGTDKLTPIDFIMIEGGTKITDSLNYYNRIKKTEDNYFDPAKYFQAGISHSVKNKFSVFHALTIFNQQSFIGTLRQKQYYIKPSFLLKNDWLISPSFHFINLNFESVANTAPPPNPPGPGMPPPPRPKTVITTSNYFVTSLNVQKTVNKFTLSIGNLYSNMSGKTQYINSFSATFWPLGNSRIVMGCTGYLHTTNGYSVSYGSVSPFLYLQPLKKISLKISYLLNAGNNIIEENGYLVNNSPDLTQTRISALANFFISKKVSLYALYQLENKQESVQKFNYKYNVILAGIKFTPFKN